MYPLYTSDKKFIARIDEDRLKCIKSRCMIVRNRRNNIKLIYLKDLTLQQLARYSNKMGLHFEQQLSSGHVHALHGIRGSY